MLREIFKRCCAGHAVEGADLGNTMIRGFSERQAKLEYGSVTYYGGRTPRLWAQDYHLMPQKDIGGALPQAMTKVDVMKPGGENNVILYAHGSAIDGLRPRLMAMPQVYRAVVRAYGDRMHTFVFTLPPEKAAELILAMYCDRRLHAR